METWKLSLLTVKSLGSKCQCLLKLNWNEAIVFDDKSQQNVVINRNSINYAVRDSIIDVLLK